jgi:type IV secretory pathway VirB10-like protein
MNSMLRPLLAAAGVTVAIFAVGFGGGTLSAKPKDGTPAPVNRQVVVPAVRVILPATFEPALSATATVPQEPVRAPAEQIAQSKPQSEAQQQAEERPKTRRELRDTERKLKEQRRAEWRAKHQQSDNAPSLIFND